MTKHRWFSRVVRFWDGLFSLGDGWLGKRRLRRKAEPFKHLRYHPQIDQLESRQMPTAVAFSASTYSVNEYTSSINITVSLDQTHPDTVTVNYATSNGTATAGSDYTSASGTL